MAPHARLAAGTNESVIVDACQICNSPQMDSVLFLGYLPPVNQLHTIGQRPAQQPAFPAEWLYCPNCQLVQLGLVVDPQLLFPPEYPYTSGTTKILRDNFAEMYREVSSMLPLGKDDLIVDVGSNDGTLLANFKSGGHRVLGIEPSQVGNLANERRIPTWISFFGRDIARKLRDQEGGATVVTATNVFAHMEDIHGIIEAILCILGEKGIFISESHYLMSLLETLQYDTIYHEHLRYYSVHSLQYLLSMHGMEVIHAKRIPTHGGSIRVYAARKDTHKRQASVDTILAQEKTAGLDTNRLRDFKRQIVRAKLRLYSLLFDIHERGERVYGIGAPSRASTLINYVGLDDGILTCVLEVKGSLKIGKYMPGSVIPVLEEGCLFEEQPEYALLLSWHIADELMYKLRQRGFRGKFIVPLPDPRIIKSGQM